MQKVYTYGIGALFILPPYTSWKPACQQFRCCLTALHSQVEWSIRVRIPAYAAIFVTSID